MTYYSRLLSGAAAAVLLASPVLANQTDLSVGVENITITNNIAAINLSVRNMSNSTDPADRNLRMVSDPLVIPVQGQLFCNDDLSGHVRISKARIVFGNAHIAASQNGADLLPIGPWSQSPFQVFNADYPQTNFSIEAPLVLSSEGSGGVNLSGFNAVDLVEDRMEFFIENGAGDAADFLRVDDVFETTITLNAVGWCTRTTQNGSFEYAGLRSIEVPVHVFYHGDADIASPLTVMDTANTVAAQVPDRARDQATTRGSAAAPPARNSRPARAGEPARDVDTRNSGRRGGVSVAAGDISGDGRKSQRRTPAPRQQAEPQDSDGDTEQRSPARQPSRPDIAAPTDPQEGGATFVKFEGVDGESTDGGATSQTDAVRSTDDEGEAGMILPAVQHLSGVEPDEID